MYKWLINKLFAHVYKQSPLANDMNSGSIDNTNCHFSLPNMPTFPNGIFPSESPNNTYFLFSFYSSRAVYCIHFLVIYFNTSIIAIQINVHSAFLG